jgi:hypothetical protein
MHDFGPHFFEAVASFLGPYYLSLALMNAVAAYYLWQSEQAKTWFRVGPAGLKVPFTNVLAWVGVSLVYVLLAAIAGSGNLAPVTLPLGVRNFIDSLAEPEIYSIGTTLMLAILFLGRRYFVQPAVAWAIWNLMLLFLGLSMPDPDFYAIVAKPDNVPIVALVFFLAFFTWVAAYRAVQNDDRKAQGLPPLEKETDEKILVWPDLVYTELICMIGLTALLIFWAIALEAPLEEPASAVKTPNPSKAPWYFLGLQEMLVYYDPWMAGVVLPSLIIVGLMAIPYLDFNKSGNGYYTISERKFSYIVFQLGFLDMWVTLIVLGTLLRGPNWNFFGPFEYWDSHLVEAQNNVNLSEYFWYGLGMSLPKAPVGSGTGTELLYILQREAPGIILVLGYFLLLPPILAVTVMRGFFVRMGLIRFMTLSTLLLFMASLPVKMILRWTLNLKYIVAIPEYFLNF